ncbi:hypothetical protein SMD22_00375 (plasmid) [Brevibacillus halotolerans]|nr:hypothetical protein SMD22_00375 [Brevibacillus halotolerans]
MNIYFNKKQQKALNALLNTAEELITQSYITLAKDIEFEDFLNSILEIKSKVNGTKRFSKNGVLFPPIEISCINSDDKLIVRGREDGRAIILESKNRKANGMGGYSFNFSAEQLWKLTNEIIKYLDGWGISYNAEDKAYSDEINVFADEVERSISISRERISFICYTDDHTDDHWAFLTPHKAKYFAELLLGYVKLSAIAKV